MTIVVTVKINDGIVLASDSATTFRDPATGNVLKIYNNANKIFNLVKRKPIGALTFGSGGIGSASITTISKDLRRRFAGEDPDHLVWSLPENYSMEWVASKVREFFFEELYRNAYDDPPINFFMGYKICGYGANQPLPELWHVEIRGSDSPDPSCIRDQASFGPNWDGEYEAMDRLMFGVGSNMRQLLHENGLPEEQVNDAYMGMVRGLSVPVVMAAMPIQDAIELAKFMVETTIRFVRFNLRSETVGGPVEVATITKHEGFRWVQRKHFFPLENSRLPVHHLPVPNAWLARPPLASKRSFNGRGQQKLGAEREARQARQELRFGPAPHHSSGREAGGGALSASLWLLRTWVQAGSALGLDRTRARSPIPE